MHQKKTTEFDENRLQRTSEKKKHRWWKKPDFLLRRMRKRVFNSQKKNERWSSYFQRGTSWYSSSQKQQPKSIIQAKRKVQVFEIIFFQIFTSIWTSMKSIQKRKLRSTLKKREYLFCKWSKLGLKKFKLVEIYTEVVITSKSIHKTWQFIYIRDSNFKSCLTNKFYSPIFILHSAYGTFQVT